MSQTELFGFREMLPKTKVPISAERIRQVKEQIKNGDGKGALKNMRRLREGLEDYERRLSNRK